MGRWEAISSIAEKRIFGPPLPFKEVQPVNVDYLTSLLRATEVRHSQALNKNNFKLAIKRSNEIQELKHLLSIDP